MAPGPPVESERESGSGPRKSGRDTARLIGAIAAVIVALTGLAQVLLPEGIPGLFRDGVESTSTTSEAITGTDAGTSATTEAITGTDATPTTPPPDGYLMQDSYDEDCLTRPPSTVCITYPDGYRWLISEPIQGRTEEGQQDGNIVSVVHGFDSDYYHILDTLYVSERPPQFADEEPYGDDCTARPPNTFCVSLSDGYVLLVSDSIQGFEDDVGTYDGNTVVVRHGDKFDYYHVLSTNLVKAVAR